MQVRIKNFNNNIYYDGGIPMKVTDTFPMPNTSGTIMLYENANSDYDMVLDESKESESINTIDIELLIDEKYSNDINSSNPLYMKLVIS
jgi:hypothetical protein